VREEPDLARRLVTQLPPIGSPRAVSVTQLLAPRRAFWGAVHPVPFAPERQSRLDQGRAEHRRLGLALATEGQLEVRVRRFGMVGRIDLLSDVPVEVKTSSSTVAAEDLRTARPDQLEQLAMYCALAARPAGRLVTLALKDGVVDGVRAADLRVHALEAVKDEMRTQGERLRAAWAHGRPTDLPSCRWYGRGCEFQEARVCDCTGSEPPGGNAILDAIGGEQDRPDVAIRIEARLRESATSARPGEFRRFRDVIYPRRAYFDRRSPGGRAERTPSEPLAPLDAYGRATAAIESGPVGEASQLPALSLQPAEDVAGFLGEPLLVRSTRTRTLSTAATLVDRQPQYAFELGLRARVTGHDLGYLVLAREAAVRDDDRLQVFRFRFAPIAAFERVWKERTAALAAAETGGAPGGLPPCPDWMYSDCPYRTECRCGAAEGRSQR
jgi:hypothetical protein